MNNILLICGVFPDIRLKEIEEKSINFNQGAAENYQRSLINGLTENNVSCDLLSAPFIGAWPKNYKDMYYKSSDDFDISFCNVWGIRNFSRYLRLKRKIKKYNLEKYNQIVIYSVHTPLVKLAKIIKKINKESKICLFVPDIPEYINLREDKSFLYKIAKKIDIKSFYRANKVIDSYVFLTEAMNEVVNKTGRPYFVLEGFVNQDGIKQNFVPYTAKTKKIVYTGSLNAKFGVNELIASFIQLNRDDAELVICGSGDLADYISAIAKDNKKIQYLGQVSAITAKKIQHEAFALVNPRMGKDEYVKYSFPSKTLEYLATGNPVIAYDLLGIPEEYISELIIPRAETIEALSEAIDLVLNFDTCELQKIYEKNINFIKRKTDVSIIKEVIRFFENNAYKDGR
ncbi:MAG: glycosyltransferase [Clostridia bacterium]|nr:glycosyltransferase [Clostridia bacterium]